MKNDHMFHAERHGRHRASDPPRHAGARRQSTYRAASPKRWPADRHLRALPQRLLALVLGLAMTFSVPTAALAQENANASGTGTPVTVESLQGSVNEKRDVTVVAFQQSWNTIADECERVYGPEGVGYVQVSPPQESIRGTEWWTSYQPISYALNSKFGSEAEFASMIARCNAAGIDIIADVVLNHTSGTDVSWVDDQLGVNGTAYNGTYGRYLGIGITQYEESGNNYQYGLASGDFHSCKSAIADYTNVTEVQECRLSTMWDINTGSEKVREIQAEYLAHLWNLGVRGYLVDSAKHIAQTDLAAIKAKLAAKIGVAADEIPFQQEVIYHSGEAAELAPSAYVATGQVSEFTYANRLLSYLNGSLSQLQWISSGLLDSDDATVFVNNWDTERGSETLNYSDGGRYEIAMGFMLAYGYGQPQILSSYYADPNDTDAGPTGASETSVPRTDLDVACAAMDGTASADLEYGQWLCQQRWTSVRGMIGFHNAVGDAFVASWQQPATGHLGFARTNSDGNDVGFFAINNTLESQDVTYSTNLPDGIYCDVYNSTDCSRTVTVENGQFTAIVPKRGAVAIYYAATPATWTDTAGNRVANPGYDDQAATDKIGDRALTIYYFLPDSYGWDDLYVQVAPDGTVLNGTPYRMTPSADVTAGRTCFGLDEAGGTWYEVTIPDVSQSRTTYRFTNDPSGSSGLWDYNDGLSTDGGSKLYEVAAGTTTIYIRNHDAKLGVPYTCVTGVATLFTVHYNGSAASTGIVAWGTDVNGQTMEPTYFPFDAVNDSWGKRMSATLDGYDFTTVMFRVVNDSTLSAGDVVSLADVPAISVTWDSYGANVLNENNGKGYEKVRGAIECWLDGQNPDAYGKAQYYNHSADWRAATTIESANDVKNPTTLKVKVHYLRADGNYQEYDMASDAWYGWDLYTWWNGGTSSASFAFTGHDDWGLVSEFTVSADAGVHQFEFIVRQGGSSWLSKDPDNDDRALPESVIQVAAGNSAEGEAEIWLISSDKTVYAYQPAVAAVTFEPGFDWHVDPQLVQLGGTVTIADNQNPDPLVNPYGRTGYVLKGWTRTAADDGDYFQFGVDAITARTVLYAQWQRGAIVTFDSNGGSSVAAQTVELGSAASEPAAPTREGYTFVGWSTADAEQIAGGLYGLFDFATALDGDLTLTAVWQRGMVTVTVVNGDVATALQVEYGATMSVDDLAEYVGSRADEQFVGWVSEDGGTTAFNFSAPVTEPVAIYAKWVDNGTNVALVTFHTDSDGAMYDSTGDVSIYAVVGERISPISLDVPDGKRLDGWTTQPNGTSLFDFATETVPADGLTLFPKWVTVWTVSFNLNADDVQTSAETAAALADQIVDDGGCVREPDVTLERDRYEFVGWYTSDVTQDSTTKFAFCTVATDPATGEEIVSGGTAVTGNLTLYARWEKAGTVWTVKFNLNGGAAPGGNDAVFADQRVFDGDYLTKPVLDPVRDGYVFEGWTTVKNDLLAFAGGGSVFGFDASGNSLIPIDRNGTLYALWSRR